ncbi:DUF4286 family protein [Bordetella genomosp. 1]|uniref:Uncharacterized protein n=1 Tax=Bordetella genomosp. 1 TaxID=1395607 RepID=A0ABX4EZI2_9BORD|nr:DUF4286 family protein [Bordetella genomosp. 1]MDQ8031188.1 DUF4286 family protein [Bordetella sp.]OZI58867.1 hypothetical protein CAL27_19540 [Bordetella genomosp. 1]
MTSHQDSLNGMLFVATDVDPAEELDFNRWYDREHVEERVRIPGFLSGARYSSVEGGRKYLGLYRTRDLGAFTSDDYRAAFGQQTAWSVTNLDRMRNPMRRVCAVEATTGFGSGAHLVVLPLGSAADSAAALKLGAELAARDGFIHGYLLTPDATLSSPLPRESTENRQLLPIYVIEASTADAARALRAQAAAAFGVPVEAGWLMALGWKLTAADLA